MNILFYNVHTPFFYNLSFVGHEWHTPSTWNYTERVKPKNFHDIKEEDIDDLTKKGFFDLQVLSTPQQFQNRRHSLPTIYIEHNVQSVVRCHDVIDSKVVIMWGERVSKSWLERADFGYVTFPEFMHYEPYKYNGNEKIVLTVCNNFKQRDWCSGYSFVWKKVIHTLSQRIVGEGNEEISKSIGHIDFKTLKGLYASSRVYFNTQICWNTTASQEAIMTGMPFICTDIYAPFTNEEEIIKSRDLAYLRTKLIELLDDVDKCKEMGARIKKKFLNRMSFQAFKDAWELGFEEALIRFK